MGWICWKSYANGFNIVAIMEQKKCWELLAQNFDQFQTLRSNKQHGVQTDGVFGEQCYICLDGTKKGGLGKLKGEKGK